MGSLATVADEVISFHEQLCGSWEQLTAGPVDPGMILHVPDEFPWEPLKLRGLEALTTFRAALSTLTDGTFSTATQDSTADEHIVAVRCRECAARDSDELEWSSMWIYVLARGAICEARIIHALPGDKLAQFWCG